MHSCKRGSGGLYLAVHHRQRLRFEEFRGRYRPRPSSTADLVAGVTAVTAITMATIDRTFAVIGGIDGFVDSLQRLMSG